MPLSSVLGAQSLVRPGVCTSTTRPASPFEGQLIFETDTNRVVAYDGSNWVYVADTDTPPGLELVGQSSFSTVSTASLDNVFTSTYQNYRVMLALENPASGNQTVTMRLRVSSSDNSTSSYFRMLQGSSGGGGTEVISGSSTSFVIGYNGNTSRLYSTFDVFRPQQSEYTAIGGTTISNNSAFNSISRFSLGGWFEATTSFDGLSILLGANTTGTIRVYGYRNS